MSWFLAQYNLMTSCIYLSVLVPLFYVHSLFLICYNQCSISSIEKAKTELGWEPKFGLVDGLTDSYNLDFGRGTFRKAADFTTDDIILEKLGKVTVAL